MNMQLILKLKRLKIIVSACIIFVFKAVDQQNGLLLFYTRNRNYAGRDIREYREICYFRGVACM